MLDLGFQLDGADANHFALQACHSNQDNSQIACHTGLGLSLLRPVWVYSQALQAETHQGCGPADHLPLLVVLGAVAGAHELVLILQRRVRPLRQD